MPEASGRTKVIAGLSLVCVQSTVGILYKVSQAATGGFHYSTMSAVALAELVKLILSSSFHVMDKTNADGRGDNAVANALVAARSQLSPEAVGHILVLALLYAVNNQLSFFVYMLADPGTIFLFKAAATVIVAGIQCIFVGKHFSGEQWKAMFLQGVGMIVVQYNPCASSGRYEPRAYLLMGTSVVLSSLAAVRNEYLVKNYAIGLNVQNMVLYSAGVTLNVLAFYFVRNPNNSQDNIGFFDGYSNPLAVGVVVANGLIGLAMTAVYKYADAITKCIASDTTAVVMCIVSSIFFELKATITMWCGVVVVCYAIHSYTVASQAKPAPNPEKPEQKEKYSEDEAGPDKGSEGGLAKDAFELKTLIGKEDESGP